MAFWLDKMVMVTTVATVVVSLSLSLLPLRVHRRQVCLLLGYYIIKSLMLLRFIDFPIASFICFFFPTVE